MSSVYKIIEARRTVRKYSSKNISKKVLRRILNAARWAPSAHNAQPWRFIVIQDSTVKRKLAETMASEWNKDLCKDAVSLQERERLIQLSVERLVGAPVIIVALLTLEGMDKYRDEKRQKAEREMAIQSVAASIQNLLLAAHAEELGACWLCAPLFCPETVAKVLEIPHDIKPQALITLGYPAEKPKVGSRKPLENIVFQDYWGRGA